MTALTDVDYIEWLDESHRDTFRVMLIEAEHSTGVKRFASQPWVCNGHQLYDDWLISEPFMESILDDFGAIGDFECVNLDTDDNWNSLNFHGHECRFLFGDITWGREDFRPIGTAIIDKVLPLGLFQYRFDLIDKGLQLRKAITASSGTRSTTTVIEEIEWLIEQTGITITARNVSSDRLDWAVQYDYTATTTAETVLLGLARSVNASLSVDRAGNAAFIMPDYSNVVEINEENMSADRLTVRTSTPPYKNVAVLKYDGTRRTDTTDVVTGDIVEEIEYETYLVNNSDADELLAEHVTTHANSVLTWDIPIHAIDGLIVPGTVVNISHPELTDVGVVTRIQRSPLSNATDIEVRI